jgi:hypothetical protein
MIRMLSSPLNAYRFYFAGLFSFHRSLLVLPLKSEIAIAHKADTPATIAKQQQATLRM